MMNNHWTWLYGHFGVSHTSGAKFCHSTVVREVKIIIDCQIGKQRPMRHRVLMVSEGAYYVHIWRYLNHQKIPGIKRSALSAAEVPLIIVRSSCTWTFIRLALAWTPQSMGPSSPALGKNRQSVKGPKKMSSLPNPPQSAGWCSILPGCPASLPEQSARMDLEWPGHRLTDPLGIQRFAMVCSRKSANHRSKCHPSGRLGRWNSWSAGCFAAIRTCEKTREDGSPIPKRGNGKIPYKWRFEWENGKTRLKHL